MIGITILGSTGSIGISTLDVLARHPEQFKVVALTANQNIEMLFTQCVHYQPQYAVLSDEQAAKSLSLRLKEICPAIQVLAGKEALERVASLSEVDVVMAAIVGAAGLLPTLAAVRAGKRVLLANKEVLVMAGSLFIEEVHRHGAELLPVDSEHNAIFQCLPANFKSGKAPKGVRRILLTASGGAFRNTPISELTQVTPQQACTHPNWNMGPKVTVDCATMMNKVLEIIEAHWLFGLSPENIQALLHPQSVVHSLVEYVDGSVLAQLGNPDMRIPIAQALAWPERINSGVSNFLDLIALGRLDFMPLDPRRYPCLNLAYSTLATGGTATTILNAANEIVVQAFLEGRLSFTDIFSIITQVLDKVSAHPATNLEVILEDDIKARGVANDCINGLRFPKNKVPGAMEREMIMI